jgi:RNA polymerase sigma factor (sigma-70 family)
MIDSQYENGEVSKNTGLIINLVKPFANNSNELDELIQIGRIGFLKALRSYNPKHCSGASIQTLATKIIRNAVYNYLRTNKPKALPIDDIPEHINVRLADYIPHLTQLEHQILLLRYQNYTFREIGQRLGYSKGWVCKLFHNIKDKIKIANENA